MILRDWLNAVHADHLRLGYASGNCAACVPRGWHVDARARVLRPAVVGGVPIDLDPVHPDIPVSAERVDFPRSSASRADRGAELATQPA